MGTLAFDVKDALLNTFRADATLISFLGNDAEAVTYGYGEFGAGERPRSVVWIGEIEWDEEVSIGLGQSRRDEFFRIMITIEAVHPGETQQEANAHIKEIMQRIETIVRNPRWSGLSIVDSQLKPQMLGEAPADGGRAAMLVCSLLVRARKS